MSQAIKAAPRTLANTSRLARNVAVGAIGGIAAAWCMSQFQRTWNSLAPSSGKPGQDDPATIKAADKIAAAALSAPVPPAYRPKAGAAIHYAFGIFLGVTYGAVGSFFPRVRAGFGTAYALAVELIADQSLVPAAGLSRPPTRVPLSRHAHGLASHLVFGTALEANRRLIGRWLDRVFRPRKPFRSR